MAVEMQAGKPLQRIPESEKWKDKGQFFKDTCDFYIKCAIFDDNNGVAVWGSATRRNRKMLYEVYNNQIPLEWFNHITNPYGSDKEEYQRWPAKIRPTTILRTNLDLLMSEYPKRPFSYFVSNLGDTAYNSYTDGLNQAINATLQRKFVQIAQMQAQSQGQSLGQTAQAVSQEDVPTPDDVATAFKASYKDKLAILGQKRLKRAITEIEFRRKLLKMFKDWLIAGEMISLKLIRRGAIEYRRLSPLNCDWDKSPDVDFYEDGEWFVAREFLTVSDIVDGYYEDLSDKDLTEIEKANFTTPGAFYSYIEGLYTDQKQKTTKIPVFNVFWKGKKKMLKVTHTDPMTGAVEEDVLDEAYPVADGEKSETFWVNCVYHTVRIGDKVYPIMGELEGQVSQMNDFSKCKLPTNGRCFSDTHAQNISVLEIGLPFQIMYIIVTRALEMTIAKSKGKIVLLDKNVIPRGGGWDEDKFFYYAEALGWGLMNRNQVGVDKSYNQYQVLDMTLYESIKQLIELQQHIKDEWDDVLGISRQRKAETFASDTAAGNQQALFQSTVMTDMIFIGFEEFVSRELQGILDLTRFINLDGKRQIYNLSETEMDIIEADPEEYSSADLGVYVTDASIEGEIFAKLEGYTQAMIQNGAKPSTIIEMLTAENVATLKAVIHKVEDIESQVAQQNSQSEQEAQAAIEKVKEQYLELEFQLKEHYMNAEYDRKEEIEKIKGDYSLYVAPGDGDNNGNGIPDAVEIGDIEMKREAVASKERIAGAQMNNADKERAHTERLHAKDNATKLQEIAQRRESDKTKLRIAADNRAAARSKAAKPAAKK